MDVLRDFCRQVNQSDAKFLILGGDVTDELTTCEDMVETYRILSTVDIPMYMIYGNHDSSPTRITSGDGHTPTNSCWPR